MLASEKLRVDTCTLSEGWEDVRFILRINFRAPSNEETLSKWVCLITLYFVRLIKKKHLLFLRFGETAWRANCLLYLSGRASEVLKGRS